LEVAVGVRAEAILVDFYSGGYGPTIVIDVHSEAALAVLRKAFLDVANRRMENVDLLHLEMVFRSATIDALELRVDHDAHDPEGKLLLASSDGVNQFSWAKSSEGWLQVVDLIDGLVAHLRPAHQYLIEPPATPAIIVLQFME
jgi:hypothetical protein